MPMERSETGLGKSRKIICQVKLKRTSGVKEGKRNGQKAKKRGFV